jgi:hypothetical protein
MHRTPGRLPMVRSSSEVPEWPHPTTKKWRTAGSADAAPPTPPPSAVGAAPRCCCEAGGRAAPGVVPERGCGLAAGLPLGLRGGAAAAPACFFAGAAAARVEGRLRKSTPVSRGALDARQRQRTV